MAEKRRSTTPRPWLSGWTANVDWNTAAVEVDRCHVLVVSLDASKPTETKLLWHGTRIGTAAKLKPSCLRVRLPPVLLEMHWRKNTARSSIGRTPVSHAGKMSSILIRVTEQIATQGSASIGEHSCDQSFGSVPDPVVFGLWRFDSVPAHSSRSGGIGGHRPKVGRRDAQNVVPKGTDAQRWSGWSSTLLFATK